MNWGLSAWKYIKNNKKTAATLVTALAVACMSMYVVYSLLITTSESFETVMRENSKKVSFVSISAKTLGIKSDDYKNEEDANAAFDEKQRRNRRSIFHPGDCSNVSFGDRRICI
ncbi:MAG: hypothetical protein IKN54_08475 [Lachnospiraceae bacterium]|nr:hypothetical protein [Lachnospiraceae bacterium]